MIAIGHLNRIRKEIGYILPIGILTDVWVVCANKPEGNKLMSVNRDSGKSNGSLADAMRQAGLGANETQQAQPAPQPQQQQIPESGGTTMNTNTSARVGQAGRSIMNVNSQHRGLVSRNMSGETVQKIHDGLLERAKRVMDVKTLEAFRFLVLDSNQLQVNYSSILVCMKEVHANQTHIGVYDLMIEGSGRPLQPNITTIDGHTIETIFAPSDIYNHKSHWDTVKKFVIDTFGVNAQVHDAGCTVIPTEIDKEIPVERFQDWLHNSVQAVWAVLDLKLGAEAPPFTLAEFGEKDILTARSEYGSVHGTNIVGLPVREDIELTVSASNNADTQGLDMRPPRELTRVTGYVDLMYNPQQPAQQQFGMFPMMQPQQMMPGVMYQPRLVLTSVESLTDVVSMELQLLALSTAVQLGRGGNWWNAFRRPLKAYSEGANARKGINLRDIGAIGYEIKDPANPGQPGNKIDTSATNFGDQQFAQMMSMFFNQQLLYTLDIEEAGELSWLQQTFIAAANKNEDARKSILMAANRLTLGRFEKHFPFDAPVCFDDADRIHLGYYTNSDGHLRDLRELDYLAILNLAGKDDPTLVEKWERTHLDRNIPLAVRLHERKTIIDRLLSGSVVVKGFARRVTFSEQFIKALSDSIEEAGLSVRPGNMVDSFNQGATRGGYTFQGQLVNPNLGNWMSSGAIQPNYGTRFGNQAFSGVWGR